MLDSFFSPNGIAVIGASSDPNKLGHGVVRNLINYGYRGPIYPVNPRASEILGRLCYSAIDQVPDPVDLALIIVPAAAATNVVEECGRRGISQAIVISGGFGETGPEGHAREEALRAAAGRHKIRLIGPNCIGIIDTHAPLNTTFVTGMPKAGDIGFVSQSGAMCAVVIDWANGAGAGFSRIVSLGNQVDVSEAEMIASLAEDPHTGVITAYMEGVSDGRAFMAAAKKAARRKPLLVLKGGLGEGGAKAVTSHTGVLAGSTEAYRAAFHQCGVQQAETMEELFDWARALAWQPLPRSTRVAVLTNAGGPGILAVDALEKAGLKLASLSAKTQASLRERLPAASSAGNPVDILAGSGPDLYGMALDALLSDPAVDAALVIQAPQDWFLPADLAEMVAKVARGHDKPVLASLMGQQSAKEASPILHQRRIPNFAYPERAAQAFAVMLARRDWLERPEDMPTELSGVDKAAARTALANGYFPAALAAYGINLPPARLAGSADEAARLANDIGYPVVLKIDSPEFSHKSDVGGVILDLASSPAVRSAYEKIMAQVRTTNAGAIINGVLVQKMMRGGQELIAGVRRDPQFGSLALVGSGGVEVELRRDLAMGIAPLGEYQAGRMLDETMAGTLLRGWRGAPPGDRHATISVLRRVAQIGHDFPAIQELEINPLYVLPEGSGAYALDVRGALREEKGIGQD
jgi:acetyltransferase